MQTKLLQQLLDDVKTNTTHYSTVLSKLPLAERTDLEETLKHETLYFLHLLIQNKGDDLYV